GGVRRAVACASERACADDVIARRPVRRRKPGHDPKARLNRDWNDPRDRVATPRDDGAYVGKAARRVLHTYVIARRLCDEAIQAMIPMHASTGLGITRWIASQSRAMTSA